MTTRAAVRFAGVFLLFAVALPWNADGDSNECTWWLCTYSELGAQCSAFLSPPQDPPPNLEIRYAQECVPVVQGTSGGGTISYCRYTTFCYEQ